MTVEIDNEVVRESDRVKAVSKAVGRPVTAGEFEEWWAGLKVVEREVVWLRLGFGGERYSGRKMAALMGRTAARVSQVYRGALRKLGAKGG